MFSLTRTEAVPAATAAQRGASAAPCAGLRSALLHAGERGLALRDTPFDAIGRTLGASSREVLHHLRLLQHEGAFDRIGPAWGPGVASAQCLCGVTWPAARLAGLTAALAALAALPGLASAAIVQQPWALAAQQMADAPTLWFMLAGLGAAALAGQVQRIERAWQLPVVALALAAPPATGAHDGPAADTPLAAWCEAGLPLVRHPFEAAARALARAQRDVLGSLRAWQRSGALVRLGMLGDDARCYGAEHAPQHAAALVAANLADAALAARLAREPGIAQVQRLAPHGTLPYTLYVEALGAPALATRNLQGALVHCGLAHCERTLWHALSAYRAASPRLFTPLAASESGAMA